MPDGFFLGENLMRAKLKIVIIAIMASALIAVIPLATAFNVKTTIINKNFIENSTYTIENTGPAVVIEKNISVKNEGIQKETILAKVSDNLDREITKIHEEYKAEVLGSATTAQTAETPVVSAGPTANLNEYEAAVLHLINNMRASNGLGALQPDQLLTSIARSRCSDMLANSYFSHYTPDGRNIFNIFKENGVSYVNGGENLAQSSPPSSGTPEAFLNAWMASPTHKANILRGVYNKIGIGISENGSRRVVTTVFTN